MFLHLCKGMLFGNKSNEVLIPAKTWMLWKHYAMWRKPVTEDHIYIIFMLLVQIRQIIETESSLGILRAGAGLAAGMEDIQSDC